MTMHQNEFSLRYTSSAEVSYVPAKAQVTQDGENTRVATSPRYRDQAYFWTQDWQQAERLAEFDTLIGGYKPRDIDDLIAWLHAD